MRGEENILLTGAQHLPLNQGNFLSLTNKPSYPRSTKLRNFAQKITTTFPRIIPSHFRLPPFWTKTDVFNNELKSDRIQLYRFHLSDLTHQTHSGDIPGPHTMAQQMFKQPHLHPQRASQRRSRKDKKRDLSGDIIDTFNSSMDIVLDNPRDNAGRAASPQAQAQPWEEQGRTGITLRFPKSQPSGLQHHRPRRVDRPPEPTPSRKSRNSQGVNPTKEPDTLQKLLDGVATPAELRAAESSTYVPDEVLLQAVEEYEASQRNNNNAESSDPKMDKMDDDIFGPDFFETDPFWSFNTGRSIPDHSPESPHDQRQILRDGATGQEELEDTAITLQTTGDQIMQRAINSIQDVSETDMDLDQAEPDSVPPSMDNTEHSSMNTPRSTKPPNKRSSPDHDGDDPDVSKPHEKSRRLTDDEEEDLPNTSSNCKGNVVSKLIGPRISTPKKSAPSSSKKTKTGSRNYSRTKPVERPDIATGEHDQTNKSVQSPVKSDNNTDKRSETSNNSKRKDVLEGNPPNTDEHTIPPRGSRKDSGSQHNPNSSSSQGQSRPPPTESSRAKRRQTAFQDVPVAPAEQPLAQPRVLEDYTPNPDDVQIDLNTSSIHLEICKLISDARSGATQDSNSSVSSKIIPETMIKKIKSDTLFSAEDLLPPDTHDANVSTIHIPEIPAQSGAKMIDLKIQGDVPLVLLTKRPADKKWSLPALDVFDDYMNLLQCSFLKHDRKFCRSITSCKRWNQTGTFTLRPEPLSLFNELRDKIVRYKMDGWIFNTYPKDRIARCFELTALLKNNLRAFDLTVLPAAIFTLNGSLNLRGSLECYQYQVFDKNERSKQGELKTHWRLASLSADEEFMNSIKPFPQSQPFFIGSATIQVRGGERRREEKKKPFQHRDRGSPNDSFRNNPGRHPQQRHPRDRFQDGPSGRGSRPDLDHSRDFPRFEHPGTDVPVFANHDRAVVPVRHPAPRGQESGAIPKSGQATSRRDPESRSDNGLEPTPWEHTRRRPRPLPPCTAPASSYADRAATRPPGNENNPKVVTLVNCPIGGNQDMESAQLSPSAIKKLTTKNYPKAPKLKIPNYDLFSHDA